MEGIKLDLERLEHLRKVTFKEARQAQPKPKRSAKPRKKVQRSYRAVTELDAQQIWTRKQAGESFHSIARALFMRVATVFYSYQRMRERDGSHIDARLLNGRKTKTKITPAVAKMLLSQQTLQAWSGLFVSQRVAKLRNEHNFDICVSTLKRFYKKNGK